jgi:hypothetical protein
LAWSILPLRALAFVRRWARPVRRRALAIATRGRCARLKAGHQAVVAPSPGLSGVVARWASFQSVAISSDAVRRRLYAPELQRDLQSYSASEVIRAHWDETAGQHPLDQVQYTDIMTYLPGDILTKVDRASMAHSLEVRVPLLDHVLVEWAAMPPPRLRLNARGSKYLLKQALRPHLPPAILRRRKMGFSVPLAAWLRGSLCAPVRRALAGPAFAQSGLFDTAAVARLIEQHQSGRSDHSRMIWALFMSAGFLARVHAIPVARAGFSQMTPEPAPSRRLAYGAYRHTTFRSAWRLSRLTAWSARRSAAGSSPAASTRSP